MSVGDKRIRITDRCKLPELAGKLLGDSLELLQLGDVLDVLKKLFVYLGICGYQD